MSLRHAALGALLAAAACDRQEPPQTPPRQLSESPFQYPEELWDAGVEGQTTLRIYVTSQGTVDSARVETGSGYPAFDSAALAGSRRLRFEPARRGEEAVAAWFLLPVQFQLGGDAAQPQAPAEAPPPTDSAP
ncbi:MAG TPA: energy transducer TonB [Longimicrobiaceae bacterium]|nr:energy transducer TonB [Longimicrobiaceae bacterium]